MAATKRNFNWRSCVFTPTSGSPTTLTGVTSVQIPVNANIMKFTGDADRFVTTAVNDYSEPQITVACADLAAVTAIGVGQIGTFSAINKDARAQTSTSGSGDMTVSCYGITGDASMSGGHRQWSQGNFSITGISLDGVTSPIGVTFTP